MAVVSPGYQWAVSDLRGALLVVGKVLAKPEKSRNSHAPVSTDSVYVVYCGLGKNLKIKEIKILVFQNAH
jgi:hypothetical protein